MVTLSIIGTAGRDKSRKLTLSHFNYMCQKIESFIKDRKIDRDLTLVSGGAAWADHVAVDTFLNNSDYKLVLYLPCPIITEGSGYQFLDTGVSNWRTNSGRTTNKYHEVFSNEIARDSIKEIMRAKEKGALLDSSSNGFHARNTKVSMSDYLVAFTFGKGSIPEKGGTLDTWNKAKTKNKYHFSLEDKPMLSTELLSSPFSPMKAVPLKRGREEEEEEERVDKDAATNLKKIIIENIPLSSESSPFPASCIQKTVTLPIVKPSTDSSNTTIAKNTTAQSSISTPPIFPAFCFKPKPLKLPKIKKKTIPTTDQTNHLHNNPT